MAALTTIERASTENHYQIKSNQIIYLDKQIQKKR